MPKPYEEMSFLEFQEKYPDETACEDKLFSFRWPEGFVCPKCGGVDFYDLPKRALFQCKQCKYQASLTAGTVMHKTRTPLLKWFWAIYLTATDKRGLSALALKQKIGVGYKTAWTMLHKIRKAMEARDADYQLAGVIQADDAFFKGGVKKGGDKRGRGTSKVPVLVMAATRDKAITFAKMEVLDTVDGQNIEAALEKHVAENQTIVSDGLPAFNVAEKLGHEHVPEVVYPKSGPPNYDVLSWVNILVSNAKAFILGTYHGVMKKHLQKYLDEFCYRFNRRWWPEQTFDRLLMACSKTTPVGYSELTG